MLTICRRMGAAGFRLYFRKPACPRWRAAAPHKRFLTPLSPSNVGSPVQTALLPGNFVSGAVETTVNRSGQAGQDLGRLMRQSPGGEPGDYVGQSSINVFLTRSDVAKYGTQIAATTTEPSRGLKLTA